MTEERHGLGHLCLPAGGLRGRGGVHERGCQEEDERQETLHRHSINPGLIGCGEFARSENPEPSA